MIDLKDIIDIKQHQNKINREVQKIRNNHPLLQTNLYLHDLFEYFISDIEDNANQIYHEALLQGSLKKIKIEPSKLEDLIRNGTMMLLDDYNRIIQGYNAGGLFRGYDNVQNDIEFFKVRAKQACEKQSTIKAEKYINYLNIKCEERWTLNASIIAAIAGVFGVVMTILTIVMNFYSATSNYKDINAEKPLSFVELCNICPINSMSVNDRNSLIKQA